MFRDSELNIYSTRTAPGRAAPGLLLNILEMAGPARARRCAATVQVLFYLILQILELDSKSR